MFGKEILQEILDLSEINLNKVKGKVIPVTGRRGP
jgi:hypothetical protein